MTFSTHQFSAEWEGIYQYDIDGPACHWSFNAPNAWNLAPKDEKQTKRTFASLADKIHPLINSLKKEFVAAAHILPDNISRPSFPKRFTLLDWATTATTATTANPRLIQSNPAVLSFAALMLNHVVSSGTVRPFKILSTFVGGHVTCQIKGLPSNSPCWFYSKLDSELTLLDEYLLTFPELFFKLDDGGYPICVRPQKELEPAIRLLNSHRILNNFTILTYSSENKYFLIRVLNSIFLTPYERGALCGCIPIPGPIDNENTKCEPELVATPEVVVTSPMVAKALNQLSRVWADRFAKSVLISAPPGSGKENLAISIPFGQGRQAENFTPISLASGDLKSLLRTLYGKKRKDGSIELGLLAQAQATNSAIFLDEVHQPRDEGTSARPSLLRPLEAGEILPIGSNKPQQVKNVLFVLATSTLVKDLGRVPPKDFWTRMTHVVPIKHPLDFQDSESVTKHKVIQDFFKFFWWDRTKSFYIVEPDRCSAKPADAAKLIPVQHAQTILDSTRLQNAAVNFATALVSEMRRRKKPIHYCSIRGIRSMTSRLFSIAANEIANGRDDIWHKAFDENLEDVVREIMPMALLSKKQTKLH